MPINQYDTEYMSPVLYPGSIAEFPQHQADTLASSEVIPWGKAVQYNATNKNRCDVYKGTQKFAGIAQIDGVATNFDGPYQYPVNAPVTVLREGRIWVRVLEDVVKSDGAVVDPTTGDFRKAGTATAGVSAVIGMFRTAAVAGELAVVEIKLPGGAI